MAFPLFAVGGLGSCDAKFLQSMFGVPTCGLATF